MPAASAPSSTTSSTSSPTILEVTGIKAPEMVDGIKQKPIEGVSMVYTFDKANTNAPSARKTQYFEMIANRGIYHEGWYANTTPPHGPWILNAPLPAPNDYKWELYNLKEDYSQANDLAAKMPGKLKESRRCSIGRRPSTTCFRSTTGPLREQPCRDRVRRPARRYSPTRA